MLKMLSGVIAFKVKGKTFVKIKYNCLPIKGLLRFTRLKALTFVAL